MNFTVKRKIELLRAFLVDFKASMTLRSALDPSLNFFVAFAEGLDPKSLKMVKGTLCY